jgi:hypothetical protein
MLTEDSISARSGNICCRWKGRLKIASSTPHTPSPPPPSKTPSWSKVLGRYGANLVTFITKIKQVYLLSQDLEAFYL